VEEPARLDETLDQPLRRRLRPRLRRRKPEELPPPAPPPRHVRLLPRRPAEEEEQQPSRAAQEVAELFGATESDEHQKPNG